MSSSRRANMSTETTSEIRRVGEAGEVLDLTRPSHGLLPALTSRISAAADELLEAIDALCLAFGLDANDEREAGVIPPDEVERE